MLDIYKSQSHEPYQSSILKSSQGGTNGLFVELLNNDDNFYFDKFMVYARLDDINPPDEHIFRVISTSLSDDKKVKFIHSILEKDKSFNQGALYPTKIKSNLFQHLNIKICRALIDCYGIAWVTTA